MGRHDHGTTRIPLLLDYVFHQTGIYGIEAGERFIDHQNIRSMQHRSNDLGLLLHTLAQLLDLLAFVLQQIHSLQPSGELGAGLVRAHALECCQVHKRGIQPLVAVKAPLFGQISDTVKPRLIERPTQDAD
ncbi:MAG: hypothetical protein BWY79_01127 [Actinobacteria bacterium ADurb.Bin444]|nr:MAG: hypothetical protein BWY79_01127 [Actinobacteria bacterium ADurb.Bin444]